MTTINKQKFLAELGKLLTFMYEEDRQAALAMYNRMFDATEDDKALLQYLGSPTKQAVVIARSYDAKERKLQVTAQARNEDGAESQEITPDFVVAINRIYDGYVPAVAEKEPEAEDQFSLFEDARHPIREDEYVPFPVEREPAHAAPEDDWMLPEEEAAAAVPAEPTASAAAAAPAEDAVDEFLSDFTIENDELAPEPSEDAAEPETPVLLPEEPAVTETPLTVEIDEPEPEPLPAARPVIEETVRRPRVFLLILFVLFAVPITLVCVLLLLIPTVLCLALAASVIAAGCAVLFAAFSGFSILADILIVLGCALVILAVGLLLLWLFIWFVGGAIAGLIRNVIALGGKWCYKEVPV